MLDTVSTLTSYLRQIVSLFDFAVYYILQYIYTIFFYVAQFNFVDGEMVFKFFGRVQLIIGVFMMFQLAMTIIKGIINPDSFLDSKTGAKNLIMRIIVSLTLLTMLVPINISNPRNEYERRINNHGILFGTLYSLQYRLLNDNTIGRLVFGNDNTDYTSSDSDYGGGASQRFASMVLKSFYMLNRDEDGNFVCTGDSEIEEAYDDDDASIFAILAMADDTCDSSGTLNGILTYVEGAWMVGQAVTNPTTIPIHATSFFITHNITNEESYVLTVIPIVSTIAGIVLCVLIFMMTFDVAVRAMKLAALQLMAPIPIISYMDPKGGKDGAFNSWVKLLTSTYLDLFIRLAVIYFSLNIVSMLINKLPELIEATVVNPLLMRDIVIIIIIAIFIFAKQAPKFFKQMLGIKDSGEHFFNAFGQALGLGVSAVGAVGSFNANRQASFDADIARGKEIARQRGLTGAAADNFANSYASRGGNRAKHLVSGIFGAGLGLATGSAAASESKGNGMAKMMASMNAMNKRNQNVRAAGRDGGSFFGAVGSLGQEVFEGQNAFDRLEAGWKAREQKIKDQELVLKTKQDNNARRKNIMDRAKSKATDCDYTQGTYKGIVGNYRGFHSAYEAAINNGIGVHTQYADAAGNYITKSEYDLLDANSQRNYHEESWFEYSYTDRNGVAHDNQRINMAEAKDIDMGLYDKNTEDFYEEVVRFETSGGTSGHNDNSIAADRKAYRDAKIAEYMSKGETEAQARAHNDINLEAVYGTATGLKAKYGDYANENNAESDKLNRERRKINEERQGYEGQRAAADSKRFRNK